MKRLVAVATTALLWSASSGAQELEPRAYRALPVGFNFGLLAYTLSSGNVILDAATPIEGLELDLNTITGGYLRTLPLFGRSATFLVLQPYVLASGSGRINGETIEGSRNAPGDTRLKLSVNLIGGPALKPAEFARTPPKRTIGASLTVTTPTGQYNQNKVVNFGANRWGFKPEIGYSNQRGRWINDMAAGVWVFTENTKGFGGTTVHQDPIGSFQIHLSYNFDSGVWLALDANFFTGGRTEVDGIELANLQRNSRIGFTLSVPLGRRDSLKVSSSTGAYTRFGADFDVGSVAYQRRFGGPSPQGPPPDSVDPESGDPAGGGM